MLRFEELQALWQRQPQPAAADLAMLRRSLRDYGARLNRIYLLKSAVSGALILWAMFRFAGNAAMLAALAALAAAAGAMIFADWRDQRAITRLDFTEVSVAFVRQTVEQLSRQREVFAKRYGVLLVAVAAVENVVAAVLCGGLSWRSRLAWHAAATVLPLAPYQLGRWVRARRFEREAGPIIGRLRAIQRALEEPPE